MKKENHSYFEMEQNGMTVIFESPEKIEDEECIKTEVKNILSSVLQQYLATVS